MPITTNIQLRTYSNCDVDDNAYIPLEFIESNWAWDSMFTIFLYLNHVSFIPNSPSRAQIYDHDVTICYIVATSVKVKPFKTLAGCASTVIEGIFIYLLVPIIDTQ